MAKFYKYDIKLKALIAENKSCKEAFAICQPIFKLSRADSRTFERRYSAFKNESKEQQRRLISKAEYEAAQEFKSTLTNQYKQHILTRTEGLGKLTDLFFESEKPTECVQLFDTIAEFASFSKRNDDDNALPAEVLNGVTKAVEANPIYVKISQSKAKYVCVKGGSRSGKTWAIAQMCIDWLLIGKFCGHSSEGVVNANFDILREELTTLKNTVKIDLDTIIANKGLNEIITYRAQPCSYSYGGRTLRLKSCTEESARGEKREFIWLNEADTLNEDVARQLLMRGAKKIIFDYNPADCDSWIVNGFEKENGAYFKDSVTFHSTFLDNYFLEDYVREEIERLKYVNNYLYNVYTLGLYAQKEGVILTNVRQVADDLDAGSVLCCEYYTVLAMDLGSTDPTTVVAVHLPKIQGNKWEQRIFVEQILYKSGATISDVKKAVEDYSVKNKLTEQPYIYTDNANAQMIGEFQRQDVKAVPCKKGAGSVFDGVVRLQSYEIITREGDSELNNELRMYTWAKDSSGKALGRPIDKYNHAIDAIRYAMKALLG